MGMGEPLDNFENVMKSIEVLTADWGFAMSGRRITVSTSGLLPRLREFLDKTNVHLAVSLHNPIPEERESIMPIEKAYKIQDVVEVLKDYDWSGQRRLTFEYIVFEGLNNQKRHVLELLRLLDGLNCRINLIRFHTIPNTPYISATEESMIKLRDALSSKGIICTIRASRGEDILAACGLLSTKKKLENVR
jgi:23S rRNA (adenine2503-C2)-methyltransferase